MSAILSNEAKEKLRNIPKSRCSVCDSPRSYTNPMERCFECKKKFCFDHIFTMQVKPNMKNGDPVRDICEKCKTKYNYKNL